MKITLKRKVELKSAVVYLRMLVETPREDIKKYLESNGFSNPIIERRVKNYLNDMGIYSSQHQLTEKGQKIRQSGMVEESEEGKYQIWYTQDDPLFGSRVFYFRRVRPDIRSNPQIESLDIKFDAETQVSLPVFKGKESVNFSVSGTPGIYRGENKKGVTIGSEWIWNEMKNSVFKFYGKFEWTDFNESTRANTVKTDTIDGTKEIDLKIDITPYIPQIIPNWNNETKRYKFKLENVSANDIYQYFEYSGTRHREGFESCRYDRLPVEPYNAEEALIWRNKLLEMELEKNYMHPDDFSGNVIAINQKEGFTAYTNDLDIPEINQYIETKLEHSKKSERGASYWHLAAPLDLNVEIPQSLCIDSFSLRQGESASFNEIARKLAGVFPVEKVFYYDKFVANYYQQRSVAALLECFEVPNMCIMTDKNNPNYSDFLSQRKPQISATSIGNIYQNLKDAPHDRYIVLKKGNELLAWTGTNSIDYIRFDSTIKDIQSDTQGNILKSVTFAKISPDVLDSQLKNFILKR